MFSSFCSEQFQIKENKRVCSHAGLYSCFLGVFLTRSEILPLLTLCSTKSILDPHSLRMSPKLNIKMSPGEKGYSYFPVILPPRSRLFSVSIYALVSSRELVQASFLISELLWKLFVFCSNRNSSCTLRIICHGLMVAADKQRGTSLRLSFAEQPGIWILFILIMSERLAVKDELYVGLCMQHGNAWMLLLVCCSAPRKNAEQDKLPEASLHDKVLK